MHDIMADLKILPKDKNRGMQRNIKRVSRLISLDTGIFRTYVPPKITIASIYKWPNTPQIAKLHDIPTVVRTKSKVFNLKSISGWHSIEIKKFLNSIIFGVIVHISLFSLPIGSESTHWKMRSITSFFYMYCLVFKNIWCTTIHSNSSWLTHLKVRISELWFFHLKDFDLRNYFWKKKYWTNSINCITIYNFQSIQ